MPTGASGIADLRLTRLQKLIERFTAPPSLVLTSLFGQDNWESDNIKWETFIGTRGLTPFVAPGTAAPRLAPLGVGESQAFAAFWKEKMYFDEAFLNNLRQPGTTATYLSAKKRLAKESRQLSNRCQRRKEWMMAKMITAGSFDYLVKSGMKISIDYLVPSANLVSLAANRKWDSGTARNIVEDFMDAKITLENKHGGVVDFGLFTSEILKLMVLDSSIQALLTKSAYGQGDLFANPERVLGQLLGVPNMVNYNQQYQIKAWLTAAVTANSTVAVSVDETTDFEANGTLTFYDVSARTSEDETISSVDEEAGTVTVSTAPATSYKAQEDYVYMTKKFLPTNKFTIFCSEVEGEKIAEFANAPFDLDRHFGQKVDSHEVWDPDGIFVRVQNKGLPVLYQEDAIYVLTVT
nr:hypothetical protein 14 [bacterium]